MAIKATSVLAFLLILNVLVLSAIGRDIPKDSKNVDVKKPETFHQEGSVLIPGAGCVMIPKHIDVKKPETFHQEGSVIIPGAGRVMIPKNVDVKKPEIFHQEGSVLIPGAGRVMIPRNVDVKKPETLNQEGSVLIPGAGRVMIPPKKKYFFKGFNPFTYNPVTGKNTGHGISIPTLPSTGPPGYVPGADDTFIPNPGFEVPTGFPAPPIRR